MKFLTFIAILAATPALADGPTTSIRPEPRVTAPERDCNLIPHWRRDHWRSCMERRDSDRTRPDRAFEREWFDDGAWRGIDDFGGRVPSGVPSRTRCTRGC